MLKVKRWPTILPTSIHLVHEHPCNFRVMGFPMPHCVSITKPHKLCGFSAPSAYWSNARKYFPSQRDRFINSCCRRGRRDSLRTFNRQHPAVSLVEHANRIHLLQIKAIKISKRNLPVYVFCANIVRQFSLFCKAGGLIESHEGLSPAVENDSWFFSFIEWMNDSLNTTCRDRVFCLFVFYNSPPRSLHMALVTPRPLKTLRSSSRSRRSHGRISRQNARISVSSSEEKSETMIRREATEVLNGANKYFTVFSKRNTFVE